MRDFECQHCLKYKGSKKNNPPYEFLFSIFFSRSMGDKSCAVTLATAYMFSLSRDLPRNLDVQKRYHCEIALGGLSNYTLGFIICQESHYFY